MQTWRAGVRQDLIHAAPGHYIAADEQGELPVAVHGTSALGISRQYVGSNASSLSRMGCTAPAM